MLKPAWTTQYPDVVSWMVFKTQGNNIWSTQTSDSTVKGAWIWEKTQITSHFVISFSLFFFYLKKIKIKMYSWNQNKTPYYTSALKTDGRTRRHGGLDCVSWFVRSTQGYSRWANQESAKTSPAVADGEGGREGGTRWLVLLKMWRLSYPIADCPLPGETRTLWDRSKYISATGCPASPGGSTVIQIRKGSNHCSTYKRRLRKLGFDVLLAINTSNNIQRE